MEVEGMLVEALEQAEALLGRQEELQQQLGELSRRCRAQGWQIKAGEKVALQRGLLVKLLEAQVKQQNQRQGRHPGSSSCSSECNEWLLPPALSAPPLPRAPAPTMAATAAAAVTANGDGASASGSVDEEAVLVAELERAQDELEAQLRRQMRLAELALADANTDTEEEEAEEEEVQKQPAPLEPQQAEPGGESWQRECEQWREWHRQWQAHERAAAAREEMVRSVHAAAVAARAAQQRREVTVATAQAEAVRLAVDNARLAERVAELEREQRVARGQAQEQEQKQQLPSSPAAVEAVAEAETAPGSKAAPRRHAIVAPAEGAGGTGGSRIPVPRRYGNFTTKRRRQTPQAGLGPGRSASSTRDRVELCNASRQQTQRSVTTTSAAGAVAQAHKQRQPRIEQMALRTAPSVVAVSSRNPI
jgi:hypothetical protein